MVQKIPSPERKKLFAHAIALSLSALAGALPVDGIVFSHTAAFVLSPGAGFVIAGINGFLGHLLAVFVAGGQAFSRETLLTGISVFFAVWIFCFLRKLDKEKNKWLILASDFGGIIILILFQLLIVNMGESADKRVLVDQMRFPVLNAAANVFLAEVILQLRLRKKDKKSPSPKKKKVHKE